MTSPVQLTILRKFSEHETRSWTERFETVEDAKTRLREVRRHYRDCAGEPTKITGRISIVVAA